MRTKSIGSIHDVARASGVSIGTVSRVFNDKADVAPATRVRVLQAAKRVHYMPRITARRLNIGLLVQEIEKASEVGFVAEMISTLAKHMATQGGILELIPQEDLEAVYRNYVRGLIAIVFGPGHEELRSIQHIPVVFINNRIDGPNFHSVASDHAQGAHLAAKHLLARGHTRIGFLEVRHDNWGALEREKGFRSAFEERGMTVPAELIAFTELAPAKKVLLPLLELRPTALLICGEELSLEVNALLIHELKIKIPEDLSVVSFEIPMVSALLSPPQTTIAQPWQAIGRTAVEGIVSMVDKPDPRTLDVRLPNQLIERGSVRRVSGSVD